MTNGTDPNEYDDSAPTEDSGPEIPVPYCNSLEISPDEYILATDETTVPDIALTVTINGEMRTDLVVWMSNLIAKTDLVWLASTEMETEWSGLIIFEAKTESEDTSTGTFTIQDTSPNNPLITLQEGNFVTLSAIYSGGQVGDTITVSNISDVSHCSDTLTIEQDVARPDPGAITLTLPTEDEPETPDAPTTTPDTPTAATTDDPSPAATPSTAYTPTTDTSTTTTPSATKSDTEESCTDPFTDTRDQWHEDIICEMYQAQVVKGRTYNIFAPNESMTRAEWIKVVDLIFGYDTSDANGLISHFTDVSPTDWFYSYVAIAEKEDVVRTRDRGAEFNPNEKITRAEAILYVIRMAGLTSYSYDVEKTFKDVKNTDYFAYALAIAEENEIVEGYSDGTFRPNNPIARSEAMAIALRAATAWGIRVE